MQLVDVVSLSVKQCQYPIQVNLKYATRSNFVGRPLAGYKASDVALLTKRAANKLCAVQNELIQHHGVGLIIYDAYRPKRAVEDILDWSTQPVANAYELERKTKHYPHIEKHQLFELGYLSKNSGHCYGNTVDVFLVNVHHHDGSVDMGTCYDYLDEKSHITATVEDIGLAAYQHRIILLEAMQKFDFESYQKEYWHFSHQGKAGREVDAPMDIEISSDLKNL